MHLLGHRCKPRSFRINKQDIAIDATEVVYAAGVNEKLLGDFIRKHNVRDKVFSKYRGVLPRANAQ